MTFSALDPRQDLVRKTRTSHRKGQQSVLATLMTTIADVHRFPLVLGLFGLMVVLAAGCGSGGGGAKNAALVAGEPIPISRLDVLMNEAQISYGKNGQAFPNPGTGPYRALRERALAYLIVAKELEQRAARQLGVHITD